MFRADLLKGRKILVTGGGTGLGKSIARRYLQLGAELVVCGRRVDVLDAAVGELANETGGRIEAIQCDVRQADQVESMMSRIWERGPLDVLVNNAAANFIARTEKLSPRAIDAVLNIVLHGSFYCTVACGNRWIEAKRAGTVLSVATTPSFTGSAFTAPSAAAKAGIVGLTKAAAKETARYGIRVNAIQPGLIRTAMTEAMPDDAWQQKMADIPMGRAGEPDEVAKVALFYASDLSSYMTGTVAEVTGGRLM